MDFGVGGLIGAGLGLLGCRPLPVSAHFSDAFLRASRCSLGMSNSTKGTVRPLVECIRFSIGMRRCLQCLVGALCILTDEQIYAATYRIGNLCIVGQSGYMKGDASWITQLR